MFRRSRNVALVGIPLVAAVVVVAGLTLGDGQSDPKAAYAVIFGAVGLLLFAILFTQSRDLSRASSADASASIAAGTPVDNPMTVSDVDLWLSLAVAPVSDEAMKARARGWGVARSSHRLAVVVCLLIMVGVPATYFSGSFVPVLATAAVVGVIALVASTGLIARGGGLDRAYADADVAMAPLGLAILDRPSIEIAPRLAGEGVQKHVVGQLAFAGERHGREVEVTMSSGDCRVTVSGAVAEFEAKARDGKVVPKRGEAPPEIDSALRTVPSSVAWKGAAIRGGPAGIEVTHRGANDRWLADLWLAERVASAAAR